MPLVDTQSRVSVCEGGVTAPRGFLAAGVHCGIKRELPDMAAVYSTVSAQAAAVFTKNRVIAAPLVVDQEQLTRSSAMRLIVVNSGNANACTGERGQRDAWDMVESAAQAFDVPASEVLVSSTGVIGKFLAMEKVKAGIVAVQRRLSPEGGQSAADAIRTTDTFSKQAAVTVELSDGPIRIGGMAKGSGMIHPNMATMLAFVTTDAALAGPLLQQTWRETTDRTFNRITVDGDTSTNDMAVILANGQSGTRRITSADHPDYALFVAGLEQVLAQLSKLIVKDGEGATKFVEVKVAGAGTEHDARLVATSIAKSSLVKTAIHGEDANWGRILAAAGYSGAEFEPERVAISLNGLPILRPQFVIEFSEEEAKKVLSRPEIEIFVNLGQGTHEATVWTCDLSKGYVDINANYRS